MDECRRHIFKAFRLALEDSVGKFGDSVADSSTERFLVRCWVDADHTPVGAFGGKGLKGLAVLVANDTTRIGCEIGGETRVFHASLRLR